MRQASRLLVLAAWAASVCAQPRPGLREVDLRLPSPSGELAVRVCLPAAPTEPGRPTPVVVVVPGGWAGGSVIRPLAPVAAYGLIEVRYCPPGEGDGQIGSLGDRDQRGPAATAALARVLEWSTGTARAADGRSLADLCAPLLPAAEVGVLAIAEGGNTALLALAGQPALAAKTAWLATWETPLGEAAALGLLGDTGLGANPAYSAATSAWDPQVLAWDPQGFFYQDLNRDGRLDGGDRPINAVRLPRDDGTHRLAYPRLVAQAAALRGIGPNPWPTDFLAGPELTEFWSQRMADESSLRAVLAARPNLRAMVLGAQPDQAIAAADHPHLAALYAGWMNAGAKWLKLNPSAAALAAALGGAPPAGYVDLAVNERLDRGRLVASLPPAAQASASALLVAAALELSAE